MVSILVLMEGASERFMDFHIGNGLDSFNPCFNGRSFRTVSGAVITSSLNPVSILVLMEGASELGSVEEEMLLEFMFQSLF